MNADVAFLVRAIGCHPFAVGPADVQTCQIADLERPHRETEVFQRRVDLFGAGAIFHQVTGGLAVVGEDTVSDEPVAHARAHTDLFHLLGQREPRGHNLWRRFVRHHDFQQPHDVGRAEEVQADHILGALRDRGNLVNVEIGGVRGKDRALFAYAVEIGEDVLLHVHIFENRFDNEVHVTKVVHVRRRGETREGGLHLLLGRLAALDCALKVFRDRADAALKRLV